MKYRELYKNGVERLRAAGIFDADTDARLLFEHVFEKDRNFIYVHGDEEISQLSEDDKDTERISSYNELIGKRATHIPLQHLTGKADFMGLEFMVNPDVLIPRIDTETVVEEAMICVNDGMKVLDMCTGSGCILISLMKYKNDIEGYACDISEKALDVAYKNAEKNGVDIHLIKSDLFEGFEEDDKYDVIISNPPYIKTSDIPGLMEEVRDHDPYIALDGHEDGLYFYRRISEGARDHLFIGGRLIFETGCDEALEVSAILEENGYKNITVKKDLSGNDRVVMCEKGLRG
ncbi:MAG: peptide chain release factor N(5)-glutamine methyltransferase [Lachnospiraceae bacterium]|nr:peptide chain release factor N(5)-glutamine methyltransferase [Lachnospiraceae bacterium]